jgi:uncharacterized protein YukE
MKKDTTKVLRATIKNGEAMLRSANNDVRRMKRFLRDCRKDALTVTSLLELGDTRLMAMDGPCGGELPDLYPQEWARVYKAMRRVARRLGGDEN